METNNSALKGPTCVKTRNKSKLNHDRKTKALIYASEIKFMRKFCCEQLDACCAIKSAECC